MNYFRSRSIFMLVFVALLSFPAIGQRDDAKKETGLNYYERAEANCAVYRFLRAMDSGDYVGLWKKTSQIARRGLTEDSWTSTLVNMRKTFGSYQSREEERYGSSNQLSGGERGTFYVLIFQSQFSLLKIEEKVVISLEGGDWKLAGYFIKTYGAK